MEASSSSAVVPHREKHDVFLSFRGEDTRDGFTSHLHGGTSRPTLITDSTEVTKSKPSLIKAIEESEVSVIIFSENYASSTWCLDELVHILECKEKFGHTVVPVFYHVDPSHVRRQEGSYAAAFAKLEQHFEVRRWRDALTSAANLSGFDSHNIRPESKLVEDIVEAISVKLNRRSTSFWKGLVGIKSRVQDVEKLLCLNSPNVRTVGIWGMGGIGKTTLAHAVFDHLCLQFEAYCFFGDIREASETRHGLNHLGNELVRILLNENLNMGTMSIRSPHVRRKLCGKKVLIVLDDVNDLVQLDVLVGHDAQFGPGSRILITTRYMQLLETGGADGIYEVKQLNEDEALQLFHVNAFKIMCPPSEYTELSKMVVSYADGIPLALEVWGSLLHCKRKGEWERELSKLKRFPNKRIQDVLRVSYDGLDEEQKDIFLEIACFYKGEKIDHAKRMLDSTCDFCTDGGIKDLTDASLISIKNGYLRMHDLTQEMGRAIVREQGVKEPGKRSRLWMAEDICQVFQNNTGTSTIEAIFLDMSKITKLHVRGAAFKDMHNLRLLKIYNSRDKFSGKRCRMYLPEGLLSLPNAPRYLYWDGYPLKSLPSEFFPDNLVELYMPNNQVEQLWTQDQSLWKLRKIFLSFCKNLTKIPDISESQIEILELQNCTGLVEVPTYFRNLETLMSLNLSGCSSLKHLPDMPVNMTSLCLQRTGIEELPASIWSHKKLVSLDLMYCQELKNLPSSSCNLDTLQILGLLGSSSLSRVSELPRNIRHLCLTQTALEEVLSSICCVSGLVSIQLEHCKRFLRLPSSICKLKCLEKLSLLGCCRFKDFPEIIEPMERLEFLNLSSTDIEELPISIENLVRLKKLELFNCKNLRFVPSSIYKIKTVVLDGCRELHFLKPALPLSSLVADRIKEINLSGCNDFIELPESIGNLLPLRSLDLERCGNLRFVPENIFKLENIKCLSLPYRWNLKKNLPDTEAQPIKTIIPEFEGIPLWVGQCCRECHMRLNLHRSPMFVTVFVGPTFIRSLRWGDLRHLSLYYTAVKELPCWIEDLIGLEILEIYMCENLELLPSSIYNLRFLKRLSLSHCGKIKSLPAFSVGLLSLNELELSYCRVLAIPDGLISIPSLRRLILSGSLIERLPAIITQVSGLECLELADCHILLSVTREVSSSRTVSWRNMTIDEQRKLILMQIASSEVDREIDHEQSDAKPSISILFLGNAIPKWFSYRNEGFSIRIKLPPKWFDKNFLGFALCILVSFQLCDRSDHYSHFNKFGCKGHFKTCDGQIIEFDYWLNDWDWRKNVIKIAFADHLVMWYLNPFKGVDGAKYSASFSNVTHAFVEFYIMRLPSLLPCKMYVKECGICLLSTQGERFEIIDPDTQEGNKRRRMH